MYNILVVDDEYFSREGLKSIIKEELKENVQVLEAENGIDAKKIVNEYDIDIIFLDLNIPGINGINLCRYIKSKIIDSNIVVTTACDDLSIKNTVIDLNINKYFVKPVRPQKIRSIIRKILNNKNKITRQKYYESYISKLKKHIINNSYKESINIIKEYLEILSNNDSEQFIKEDLSKFFEGIENICKSQNIYSDKDISSKIDLINKDYYNCFLRKNLINELTIIINHIFDSMLKNEYTTNNYVKETLNYIERNINKNITLDDASNYVNLSPHYLSKIFKKETGVNFITYLTDRRIEIAKEMLEDENIPISNIAIELSYSKSNYFSKVFKKKVGITPSEYRESHLNKSENYIKSV